MEYVDIVRLGLTVQHARIFSESSSSEQPATASTASPTADAGMDREARVHGIDTDMALLTLNDARSVVGASGVQRVYEHPRQPR